MDPMRALPALLFLIPCLPQAAYAQPQEEVPAAAQPAPSAPTAKRPLDIDAASAWTSVGGARFSNGGKWILYTVSVADGGDGRLEIRESRGERSYTVERGGSASFSFDERFVVCTVKPKREDLRQAKKEKKRGDDEPKSFLLILDLESGERLELQRAGGALMPEEAAGWLAYTLEPEKKKPERGKKEGEGGEEPAAGEKKKQEGESKEPALGPEKEPVAEPKVEGKPAAKTEAKPEPKPEAEVEEKEKKPQEPGKKPEGEEKKEDEKKKTKQDGKELVLRNLLDGSERRFEKVSSFRFAKDGLHLVYVTSTKDDGGDGLFVHHIDRNETRPMLEGEGDYRSVAFDETAARFLFLANVADYAADEPKWTLYHGRLDAVDAYAIASAGSPGIPAGWGVSQHRAPSFSDSGARILFGTAPLPLPDPEEIADDEKVVVDVWNWQDPLLQPQQLKQVSRERDRSYLAVLHAEELGRIVQLATEELPSVSLAQKNDSAWAVGTSDLAWRKESSWDTNLPEEVWLVNAANGQRRQIFAESRGSHSLSPDGRYLSWWDPEELAYFAMAVPDGEPERISDEIPFPLDNQLHDTPQLPRSYGSAGWLEEDAGFLVYDEHDLWLLDPDGEDAPVCVTDGVGRRDGLRFRFVNIDPEARGGGGRSFGGMSFGGGGREGIDPEAPMLLSAFRLEDKSAGFWWDKIGGGEPSMIFMDAKSFGSPSPSQEGGLLTFTRQDFVEAPDIWITDREFSFYDKISDGYAQQAEFLWGSSELVSWISNDGAPLQGILVKPEGFDPALKYPMVVYFYERSSDGLNRYATPAPGGSSISFSYYASNGYLVFVPDIPYRVGYPGQSAESAVLPGLAKLIDAGFVDPARIGVQGHSWGGYQIAHLVTRTTMFAAAISGAPVSNMTSAYGGIRWSTGMSRMFQYERTQSRLGGTLWEVPDRFIENSPIFSAEEIQTPVLILHNDKDGAVPWYQGIELFVALRRLDKPGWMLNYNGEDHGLRKFPNKRDYAIRMKQFFDHYLKDAPPPVWMAEGVAAVDKGRTLGLELAGEAAEAAPEATTQG